MSTTISSSSANAIASNEDLLIEILLRVSAKPLLRFKSVSKQWLSLISAAHFRLSHARRHRDNASLTAASLLLHRATSPAAGFYTIPLHNNNRSSSASGSESASLFDYINAPDLKIMQSCNGLLLCRSSDDKVLCFNYFICNPTTKKFRKINFPQVEGFVYAVNLAFNPLKSVDYKIISIRRLLYVAPRFLHVDIYSSKTDSWNTKVLTFTTAENIWFNSGVYCNGAVHWESGGESSLYLDVEDLCLNTMPMPIRMADAPEGSYREINRVMGESWGHLHLVVTYMPVCLRFNVFEMASDRSEWFLKYHVDLEPVMMKGLQSGEVSVSALCVVRCEEDDEVSKVVVFVNGNVVSYDLHYGTLTWLCDLYSCPKVYSHPSNYNVFSVFQYFETLACV